MLRALKQQWRALGAFDPEAYRPRYLPWAILAFGLLLRAVQYGRYRVLWIDEGLTATTVVSRSFGEFFAPLGLFQIVPPGYMVVAKVCTLLLGEHEYAVRLPAFLGGVLALLLFYPVARRMTSAFNATLGLAFFATSGLLAYYAAETKPYAGDAAVALALTWLAIDTESRETLAWRRVAALAFAGALALWFSFPSCFVLAAVGVVQMLHVLRERDTMRFVRLCPAYAAWAASFGVLFVLILLPGTRQLDQLAGQDLKAIMNHAWKYAFPPFPPTSIEEALWFKSQFFRFFYATGGFEMRGLAAFAWLAGGLALLRRNPRGLALLLLPMLIALGVACVKLYPFDGRMLLFLTPSLFLLVAEGIGALWPPQRGRHLTVALLLLALLLGPQSLRAGWRVASPPARCELDTGLDYIKAHWQEGDGLMLGFNDGLAYRFCKYWIPFDEAHVLAEPEYPFSQEQLDAFWDGQSAFFRQHPHVWFPVGTKVHEDAILAWLNGQPAAVDKTVVDTVAVYRVSFSAAGSPPAAGNAGS